MNRYRQLGPVDVVAGVDDFLDRAGVDVDEAARRLAQAPGQRRQIFVLGDAERTALRPAVLDEDVAEAEIWDIP